MKEKTHDLLVNAYQGWINVARAALRKAQGSRLNAITHNIIERLEEDLEAGRDPLPRLREIHQRLILELAGPGRYNTSYRISDGHRDEMARLEVEINRLEGIVHDPSRRDPVGETGKEG